MRASKHSDHKLILALSFNEQTQDLLETGMSLAKRLDCELRLIHVCEPAIQAFWGELPIDATLSTQLTRSLYEAPFEEAQEQIVNIGKQIGDEVRWSSSVLLGDPIGSLCREIHDSDAIGAVVGTLHRDYTAPLVAGYSVALGLIAEASKPVLVMPTNVKIDFMQPELKLLLADDLTEDALSMMDKAFRFFARLEQPHLLHLTVLPITQDFMQRNIELALSVLPQDICGRATVAGLLEVLVTKTKEKLTERSQRFVTLEHRLASYGTQVVFGDPSREIGQCLAAAEPHVAIFGRHKTFHWKTFSFGQIPTKILLSGKYPLFIVPHEHAKIT